MSLGYTVGRAKQELPIHATVPERMSSDCRLHDLKKALQEVVDRRVRFAGSARFEGAIHVFGTIDTDVQLGKHGDVEANLPNATARVFYASA